MKQNNTSPHILSTSANLLGFCLFVITSLHVTNHAGGSHIDEFTSLVALLLILSSAFSFFAIRTVHLKRKELLEKIADYLFVFSLFGIMLIVLFMALNFLN